MDNIFQQFNEIKNELKNIDNGISSKNDKLNNLIAKTSIFKNTLSANPIIQNQVNKVYNTYNDVLIKNRNKLQSAESGYRNIKSTIPYAQSIINKMSKNQTGLGFNVAPILAITAASGAVLGTVYGLTEILDPIERNIETQTTLLQKVMEGSISETEYTNASDSALNDLGTTDYGIQSSTGVNIPVVVITSGVIYAAYKILQKTGMLKELKNTINEIKGE